MHANHLQLETLGHEVLQSIDSGDPRADLAELDRIVARVENVLAVLLRGRALLKTKLNRLDSPMINLLPPEIISLIFTFCVPDFNDYDPETFVRGDPPVPFLLGAVCRSWRSIAWSTPMLWSCLSLHLSSQDLTILVDLMKEWLRRSGELPLSVRLSCDPVSGDRGDAIHRTGQPYIFQMIRTISDDYRHRLHALDLRIPATYFEGFHMLQSDSILESLYIDPPDGQSDSEHTLELGFTPRLRRLHLSSVYLKCVQIQWSNITHVHAYAFYVDECLEILRRAPQLVWCKFPLMISGTAPYPEPEEPLIVPSLKFLHISREKRVSLTVFINKLILPSLEELFYRASDDATEWELLISLLTRSACPLNSLTLHDAFIISELDLIRLVQKAPRLRKLSISSKENRPALLTDRLLSLMSTRDQGRENEFLSELEFFKYAGPITFSWSSLISLLSATGSRITPRISSDSGCPSQSQTLLKSNCRPQLPALKTLVMEFSQDTYEPITADDIPTLVELLEQGRNVDLRLRHSRDILEESIRDHLPVYLDRYLALRKGRRPCTES
jgi:hypothetical protein